MEARPYITCRELIDFLHLYLEDELTPDRAAEFERHLGVCGSCVNYIETYRQAIILGKHSFQDSEAPASSCAPEELVDAVLKAWKNSKR
jgi:anti-sigma factor RsiW